ncbi:MAG: hypothetical protein J0L94_01205 [Rhodothermia bacterium]|nr:hypothetical protein [Rhodothermia bacterium]
MSDKKLVIEIEVNAQGAVTAVKNLDGQLVKLDGAASKAGNGMSGLSRATGMLQTAMAGLAGVGVAEFLQRASQAALDAEKSQRRLTAMSKLLQVEMSHLAGSSQYAQNTFSLSTSQANDLSVAVTKLTTKAGEIGKTREVMQALLDLSAAQGMSAAEGLQAFEMAILGVDEGTDRLFGKNPSVLYEEYAARIGTTAGRMSDAEQAQAILTATIESGLRVQGEYKNYLSGTAGELDMIKQRADQAMVAVGDLTNSFVSSLPYIDTLINRYGSLSDAIGDYLFNLANFYLSGFGVQLNNQYDTNQRVLGLMQGMSAHGASAPVAANPPKISVPRPRAIGGGGGSSRSRGATTKQTAEEYKYLAGSVGAAERALREMNEQYDRATTDNERARIMHLIEARRAEVKVAEMAARGQINIADAADIAGGATDALRTRVAALAGEMAQLVEVDADGTMLPIASKFSQFIGLIEKNRETIQEAFTLFDEAVRGYADLRTAQISAAADQERRLFEQRQSREELALQGELDRLKQRHDARLMSDRAYEKQRTEIENRQTALAERHGKERDDIDRKYRREQAIRDRKNALWSIAINTSRAIVEALPNPLKVAFAAAAGALQAGLVLAKPIPAFAGGVDKFDGGLALVGERGPELVALPAMSSVITNQNTRALIGAITSANAGDSGSIGSLIGEQIRTAIEGAEIRIDGTVLKIALKNTEALYRRMGV